MIRAHVFPSSSLPARFQPEVVKVGGPRAMSEHCVTGGASNRLKQTTICDEKFGASLKLSFTFHKHS